MLKVGLPGVCAYVQNKIFPNVVGVVTVICVSILYLGLIFF